MDTHANITYQNITMNTIRVGLHYKCPHVSHSTVQIMCTDRLRVTITSGQGLDVAKPLFRNGDAMRMDILCVNVGLNGRWNILTGHIPVPMKTWKSFNNINNNTNTNNNNSNNNNGRNGSCLTWLAISLEEKRR